MARRQTRLEPFSHRFSCVELDAFVVMPNHVHGIVRIVDVDVRARRRLVPVQREGIRP
jgi:REP element-mobilizing transposase RayT